MIHTCDKSRRFVLALVLLLTIGFARAVYAAPADEVLLPPTTISAGDTPAYDRYSTWAFTWDRDYSALLHPVNAAFNLLADLVMLLVTLLAKFAIKIVFFAFTSELVVHFTNSLAMPFVNAVKALLWDEYAPIIMGITGMAALWYRVRSETTRAWGTLLGLIFVLLASVFAFTKLDAIVIATDELATDLSAGVFTATASVNPNVPPPAPGITTKEQALAYAGEQIFDNVAVVPWCIGQFGSIATCMEYAGPDGVYGSQFLGADSTTREVLVDRLPREHKEWMQSHNAVVRLVVALLALIIALATTLFLLLMAGLVVFWQMWAAMLLALFPFVALLGLWPGGERGFRLWFGKLMGALFMKLGLAIVLAVVLAFSANLWGMLHSWPIAVFLQVVLTAGIIINRHVFTGLVLGFADAGVAMAGVNALSQKPTGGLLGGIASDAVRRGARDFLIHKARDTASWVKAIPARRREAEITQLAQQSLMGRYALEKRKATLEGEPSRWLQAVQERIQRGEGPFHPKELEREKARLKSLSEQGINPRHALLANDSNPDHNAYTQTQEAWEQEIAQVKQELTEMQRRYRPAAQANVQRQSGIGKWGSAIGSVLYGGRRPPKAASPSPSSTAAANGSTAVKSAPTGSNPSRVDETGASIPLRQAPHIRRAQGNRSGSADPGQQLTPAHKENRAQPYELQNAPIRREGRVVVPADQVKPERANLPPALRDLSNRLADRSAHPTSTATPELKENRHAERLQDRPDHPYDPVLHGPSAPSQPALSGDRPPSSCESEGTENE